MQKLVKKLQELQHTEISLLINNRIQEFERVEDLFIELCFCLMTANFQAQKSLILQKDIGQGFHTWKEEKLRFVLKEKGHRFWPQRAQHIVKARKHKPLLDSLMSMNSKEARLWLSQNVDGLGMKESSHFLRNCGKKDVSIIDFHIIDLLHDEGLLPYNRKKSLTPKRYLEIEKVLEQLAKNVNLNLAELDLYLWYMETGKVLK